MSNSSIDIRIQKKAAFLVADLADYQLHNVENTKLSFLSDHVLLKSVVDLAVSTDLDLQEKVILCLYESYTRIGMQQTHDKRLNMVNLIICYFC